MPPHELALQAGPGCDCMTSVIGGCYWNAQTDEHRITCHVLDGGNAGDVGTNPGTPETGECGQGSEFYHYYESKPFSFDSVPGNGANVLDDYCKCGTGPRPTKANEGDYTHHGACVGDNGVRCSFSQNDCDAGANEVWMDNFKSAAQGIDCFCYDVHTGGCKNPTTGAITCAVDASSCNAGASEQWLSAIDVMKPPHNKMCRGCGAPIFKPSSGSDACAADADNDDGVPTGVILGATALVVTIIVSAYALYFIKYQAALKGAHRQEMQLVEAQGITLVQTPERARPASQSEAAGKV